MNTPVALGLALLTLVSLAGCGKSNPEPEPANPTAETSTDKTEVPTAEAGDQTKLAPIALDSFTVDPLYIGDIAKGHFNLYVKGGEPAAVRAWIGDEAATDAFVAKAEIEADHHCAHIEVPTPLPPGAKLWVEIETTEGASLKGSTEIH